MQDITSVKVTATPNQSGWAQVHDFVSDDPDVKKNRGHLFIVIATKKVNDGISNVESGRKLLSRLHEEYFGNLSEKPFSALKAATEKIYEEFKEVWGDVEICVCAIVDNVVYSASGGGASVLIYRDGGLATILASNSEGVIVASGFPKNDDVIILGTHLFGKSVSQLDLKAALSQDNLNLALEAIAPIVHSDENLGSLGAIMIKFGETSEISEFVPAVSVSPAPPIKNNFDLKQKLSSIISFVANKMPQKQIYIRGGMDDEVTSQSKKVTFSVAIILLIVLIVSIGFGIRQKGINETKSKYQGMLDTAIADVDDAISLASVSPDKSRELFIASEEKLKTIEALKVKDSKITELKQKIESSRASVLGEYSSTPELFLDLSLLSSGFKGDEVSASGGNIFILDKNGKKIVSVTISSKKSKVVAGPGVIDQVDSLASYESSAFILTSDGIYEIDSSKNKVIEKSWDGSALIRAFAGNIYVLDKSANAIYRYAGTGTTFGDKQNWLAAGSASDFSMARQWVIDGSIYILNPNSKVLKYSLGSPQSFKINGAVPEIGSVDAIYASDETEFVYFLDRAGKRVVVTDKKGGYKAQYINDEVGNATNLVVSEKDKKIILLSNDKLLSIEIKHL